MRLSFCVYVFKLQGCLILWANHEVAKSPRSLRVFMVNSCSPFWTLLNVIDSVLPQVGEVKTRQLVDVV
jgi:hypothetical protein